MSLSLPKPPPKYDPNNEAQTRSQLERNDGDVMHKSQDVVIAGRRLIGQSPSGAYWQINIADDGTLSTTAL